MLDSKIHGFPRELGISSPSCHHRGYPQLGFSRYHTECFGVLGVTNSESLNTHLKRVEKKRKRWKEWHSSREVKRRQKYKQDKTHRQLLYEQNTTEYASGVGLDIGAPAAEKENLLHGQKGKTRILYALQENGSSYQEVEILLFQQG